jgi:hypothetical protein
MAAKVEKRPLTDNMKQFTDLLFPGRAVGAILAEETEYLFINLNR